MALPKITAAGVETLAEYASFGGVQGFYRHASQAVGLPMRFGVYRPAQAGPLPIVYYLAGLTCNEETFATKAGAQRHAAEHGLIVVTPDTSPRNSGIAGADEAWDFGNAASFYLDATAEPWARHWRMESWLTQELHPLVAAAFGGDAERAGVFGHSMGGHGALTLALRHPELYRSVSALAPIAAPAQCPWGVKAFSGYFGAGEAEHSEWLRHDATELVASGSSTGDILVDQGLADRFLDEQLYPHHFESACRAAGQPLTLRRHAGYDHSYYFIATFVGDHLAHHARLLG